MLRWLGSTDRAPKLATFRADADPGTEGSIASILRRAWGRRKVRPHVLRPGVPRSDRLPYRGEGRLAARDRSVRPEAGLLESRQRAGALARLRQLLEDLRGRQKCPPRKLVRSGDGLRGRRMVEEASLEIVHAWLGRCRAARARG